MFIFGTGPNETALFGCIVLMGLYSGTGVSIKCGGCAEGSKSKFVKLMSDPNKEC